MADIHKTYNGDLLSSLFSSCVDGVRKRFESKAVWRANLIFQKGDVKDSCKQTALSITLFDANRATILDLLISKQPRLLSPIVDKKDL